VLTAIVVLAVALLIWWVGPLIAVGDFRPLESELIRWILIGITAVWPVARWAWRRWRARRASKILEAGLVAPAPLRPDASAGEVAQLSQRFQEAIALLRKRQQGAEKPSLLGRIRTVGSQQYLYDLPWYVFIGAPGSGKTTALVNSGLRFPLSTRFGREAVRGVGGTRDCDWWFTDEAVFLDTAGRYTTQQSHQEVDAGAWKGFLGLLKKSRPRRPINGVLLTISVGDLWQQSEAERAAHAQALRARVRELHEGLGVRFPIYVLVTKTDLLAGFSEFFGALGKEERAQVWGVSFPKESPPPELAALSAEFERLERRLYERLPERLEEERDPGRRAALYGFPQQFAGLRDRLADFIEATFAPTQFEPAALLRGVYFTSGTQEGSPIDRVLGAVARDLGLERHLLPPQQPSGRSYFLTRLLREVVFAEAGLVGVDLRAERRRWWLQAGAVGATAVAVVLAALAWWISYAHNRAYLADVKAQVETVKKQVAVERAGAQSDLGELLPTLTGVRGLSEIRATADGSVPWSWRFGLYQGGKLEAASRAAYQRILQDTFLPTLASYLDRYLRQATPGGPEDVYEALKTYVMLYDPKRFNRDVVWRWYEARREDVLRGAAPDAHKAFKGHFDMLYERAWVDPAVARDDALLARVRAQVSRESLAKRTYDRLKREPLPDVRDFTVTDKVGPAAMLVFERASKEPLNKGVPAFSTKDGYYKHVRNRIDTTTLQLAQEETWVLGTSGGALAGAVATPATSEAVRRLYLDDYRRVWREFINDIVVIKGRDLNRIIEVTRNLSGADSPLRTLVKAFDRETRLSVPPEAELGLTGAVTEKAQQYVGKARQALVGDRPDALVKSLVDDQFDDVHRLAGAGGTGPAPVDATVQQLNEFYQFLVAAKVALDAAQTPPTAESANKLRADGARLPEPIRSMVQGLVEGGTREVTDRVRAQQVQEIKKAREKQAEDERAAREKQAEEKRLAAEKQADEARRSREKQIADTKQLRERIDLELRAQIADFCVKAIDGRYPFVRSSDKDVTAEDFARLFAPGGLLDGFFQKQLAPHVDTGQTAWRFRDPIMGSSSALGEFQRAQVIRDVFFRGGGGTPSIQLEFKPLEMDASIQHFLLDVDGKAVRYSHGPQVKVRVQFPGPGGRSQVRVSLSPPPPSGSSGMRFEGPWALFRMFDGVKIEETNQLERFIAVIAVEGRRAVFEILASSVRNPFRLPELSQFRCPTAL
jgi:type VI secretion system protein ImpL